jgi:SAM-dependent methyltransferase
MIALLARECGLTANCTIADIGSGTGLLTKLFLEFGCTAIGVEPNAEMRQAGDVFLAEFKKFHSVDGRAERTGLPGSSVDLVAAGQAFHWFDALAARTEFHRIVRPPRWVALIWNERLVPKDGFLAGYEDLLQRRAAEYAAADHRRIDSSRITEFFGYRDWVLVTLANHQIFDLAGVRGRLLSSSYAPQPGSDAYQPMIDELDQLFFTYQQAGRVRFLYQTNVYYGML